MKRRRNNQLPLILGILIIILGFIAWGMIPGSALHRLTSPFSAVYQPVQHGASSVGNASEGFFQSLFNGMRIREENAALKSENARLQQQIQQMQAENAKYQELKEAVHIKETFDRYEVLHASVLSRSFGNVFDLFTINIGADDGLSMDTDISYPVVDAAMQLVGRTAYVDASGAKVLPLTSEGFSVIGKVNRAGGVVVSVHGDLTLSGEGLCVVDGVEKNAILQPGDEVVTDGSGGLFPSGLVIGTIAEVRERGDQQIAIMEPAAPVSSVSDVFVLRGLHEDMHVQPQTKPDGGDAVPGSEAPDVSRADAPSKPADDEANAAETELLSSESTAGGAP